MSKRPATYDLAAMEDVASPAPKKQRGDGDGNGDEAALHGRMAAMERDMQTAGEGEVERDEEEDDDEPTEPAVLLRQAAPTAGYDDLYLDTIDRHVLDFDFEKLCSVSLSNINVYACLVCGRYFQGRGTKSHAYFHALDEDHHVYINMQTQRVYVLPEGYEVLSRSLDDIKYVADPRYTRADVARLDGGGSSGGTTTSTSTSTTTTPPFTLTGKPYTPGFVGMNNIKDNDYLNVVVQALAHVPPLRNVLLLDEFTGTGANAELVKRFGLLVRKIWNPRAFKAHVSPHELLQEVALRSNRRFTLTAQSDPVDFFTWFLNNLHLGLGGSRSRPGSSIVQRVFQGRVRVESEKLGAVGAAAAAAAAAEAAEAASSAAEADAMQIDAQLPVRPLQQQQQHHHHHHHHHQHMPPPPGTSSFSQPMPPPPSSSSLTPSSTSTSTSTPAAPPPPNISRFLLLTLDLPPAPLFQDEQERNIIPQVPLTTLLQKYNGRSTHDQGDVRRRFRLRAPLPPYLVLHMKRFSANKFVTERNPTIVTFDPRGLDMRPYVEDEAGKECKEDDDNNYIYDLVANVVHEAVRARSDDVAVDSAEERRTWKVQLRDRSGATAGPDASSATTTNATTTTEDKWVVAQDLFVEPVAGELLYLAESYIQIWERRKRPATNGSSSGSKRSGKAAAGNSSK